MKKSEKLMINFLLVSFLVLLTIGLIFTIYLGIIAFYLSILLYLILSITTVVKAWIQVSHKWVYVIEKYGEFYEILNPGRHFIFPWLSFFRIKHRIYTGEMKMQLFDDEVEESDDYKEGIIDFKDESAKVVAFFFFKVTNTSEKEIMKVAYETENVIDDVKTIVEEALTSFLSQYTLSEANELKGFIGLNEVFTMKESKSIRDKDASEAWKNSKYARKLFSWGFTPTSLSISDIKLPKRVIEKRSKLMDAKNRSKIAEFEREVKIRLSEGEAKALNNMSESRTNEVKNLIKETGMNTSEAILFITDRRKYEAMAKADNITWIEGLNDEAKKNINFELGFNSKNDKK